MEKVKKLGWHTSKYRPNPNFCGALGNSTNGSVQLCTVHLPTSVFSSHHFPFCCSMKGLCLWVPSVVQKGEHSLQVSTPPWSHKHITHQERHSWRRARMQPSKAWVLKQNLECQDQRSFLSKGHLILKNQYICNAWLPLKGLKGQNTANF